MRPLLATALVLALVACGRSDRAAEPAAHGAPSASPTRGSDLLVLRVPRAGGEARVDAYPKTDSLVWQSGDRAPAIERVLGFDDDGGTVAFVDTKGRPGWIDLREGTTSIASHDKLTSPVSIDGSAIFGIAGKGVVERFTPTGDWKLTPPKPATALFPQSDGSLIVLSAEGANSVAWRVRPPQNKLEDTASLPAVRRVLRTQLGDRVYALGENQLVGLRTRNMEAIAPIDLEHGVTALVATPSGDRIFLADSTNELAVIDRYRGELTDPLKLPGVASDLRMDPEGRYLLARPSRGDSAWVVALGTGQVIGVVTTAWRVDLPFVGADGSIALADGKDVSIVDGETLRERARARGGAADYWYPFTWNGFRKPADIGEPPAAVTPVDSTVPVDTSVHAAPPPADTTANRAPGPPPVASGFTVSFAALLSEAKARDLVNQISVGGQHPRIVTSVREGTTIYRVVLGPFPTRDAADRAGRSSGQSYWVYEGTP